MFSRSRQKIVLTTVIALMLFLAATLGVIYASSWLSIKKQNSEMLERYINVYSLESPPGSDMPGLPPDISMSELPAPPPDSGIPAGTDPEDPGAIYKLSSFYSVALSQDRKALAVDAGNSGLYTKEQLIGYARTILASGKASGHISHLMYRVDKRDEYTLVAFMDMTVIDNSLANILLYTLLAGAAAICIIAVISSRLARMIIGPLEENDRRQKQFISDAGHELKTPVAVISANAEILERQTGSSEWLENIKYENKRMGELVTDLLDLSRAENASVPMESVDLSRLTEREVLPFESVAFEQGLMIDSRISEGIRVTGNPAQLRQLVSILVDNAIRHGKQGETIRVTLDAERKSAVLTVVNRGEIPQEQLPRLFDRFYRLDEARTGADDHYGLGLSIAKAISEAHSSKISVKCENSEVRFTVDLPLEKQ